MNRIFYILIFVLLVSVFACKHREQASTLETTPERIIKNIEVAKVDLQLNQLEGKWYYQGKPYNGFALKYHSNGVLAEYLGFYNGKRQGIAKKWSENGVLRVECHYNQNRLTNLYKTWWENGQMASEALYENGILNGIQKEWYPNGQLAKKRQLVHGQEKGLQQAWLPNGTIYVNYEAKNGRIFGKKRANLCYQLKDEIVQN